MTLRNIYSLQYDFVQLNGHYMTMVGPNGWEANELARIPLKMMQVNSIPRLLPLQVETINLSHSLYFDITAKKMLSPALMGTVLKPAEFYRLLFNIAAVVEDSKLYMLDEQRYLIHEDFIFFGKDVCDVYLAYIPVESLADWPPSLEQLKSLIERIGKHVSTTDSLLAFLDSGFISISNVKNKLREMMDIHSYDDPSHNKTLADRMANVDTLEETHYAVEFEDEIGAGMAETGDASYDKRYPGIKQLNITPSITPAFRPFSLKENIVLLLFLAACTAVIWNWYFRNSNEGWFYISLGLTLFICDAGFVISAVWRPRFERFQIRTGRGKKQLTMMNSVLSHPDPVYTMNVHETFQPVDHGDHQDHMEAKEKMSSKNELETTEYYKSLPHQTMLLQPVHATVLLQPSNANQWKEPKQEQYVLEISSPNGSSSVGLENNRPVIIGRDREAVQYVQDEQGVSRVHAEVFMEEEQFYAKDLGSLNGSYLNGDPMVPYKSYPFVEGDVITIVSTEFTLIRK